MTETGNTDVFYLSFVSHATLFQFGKCAVMQLSITYSIW